MVGERFPFPSSYAYKYQYYYYYSARLALALFVADCFIIHNSSSRTSTARLKQSASQPLSLWGKVELELGDEGELARSAHRDAAVV